MPASVFFVGGIHFACEARADIAGRSQEVALTIAKGEESDAVIVLAPDAGRYERQGAYDLAHYIEMMTGVALPIAETPKDIEKALASERSALVSGREAFGAKPDLHLVLVRKLKKASLYSDRWNRPPARRKARISRRRQRRKRLFRCRGIIARLGGRWFKPGDFGECVPNEDELKKGDLNVVYSSPFEIRSFSISWLGEQAGREDFLLRNLMTDGADLPAAGHNLGNFTRGLGKNVFEIPLTDPATASYIADGADKSYAAQKNISLAMQDGLYSSNSEQDKQLMSLQWDKYMLRPSVTNVMLRLYNNVADTLHKRHPESASTLGFLIYSNMFLSPARQMTLAPSLFWDDRADRY